MRQCQNLLYGQCSRICRTCVTVDLMSFVIFLPFISALLRSVSNSSNSLSCVISSATVVEVVPLSEGMTEARDRVVDFDGISWRTVFGGLLAGADWVEIIGSNSEDWGAVVGTGTFWLGCRCGWNRVEMARWWLQKVVGVVLFWALCYLPLPLSASCTGQTLLQYLYRICKIASVCLPCTP